VAHEARQLDGLALAEVVVVVEQRRVRGLVEEPLDLARQVERELVAARAVARERLRSRRRLRPTAAADAAAAAVTAPLAASVDIDFLVCVVGFARQEERERKC
jgi:hypothetical protein